MPDVVWKPHRRQEDFLSIPDSVFEAGYGGAAGGGKSEVLLILPLSREFHQHHRFKGILFRRTFPELESEIIPRSRLFYAPTGATYNQEKRRWTFPSGATISFGHMEYESDMRKYDTAEYNYMAFDEATSFTEMQYIYLSSTRCRSSSTNLPAIVRSATNPGNVGHGWYRKRFVEPAPFGTIILDGRTGNKRLFIQCKATDNPHIDPNYVTRLLLLPEAERRAKLDGDWYTFEGQVFDSWREERFPDEPENAKHVIDPFEIPTWWPRILAVDWGFSAMTCALWGALSPDNRLYVYREYTSKGQLISHWASEVGVLSKAENIDICVLCQSAWQNRGEDNNTAEKFEEFSGIHPISSENEAGSRVAGKLLMQEYLRWQPRPKRKVPASGYSDVDAQSILRKFGLKAYNEYLELFVEEPPENNLPKLQVFKSCEEFRRAIPLCVYEDKDRATGKPGEDVKEFNGDDPYDTGRYLIKGAEQIIHSLENENNRRARLDSVIKGLVQTNNQTNYYRQMEKLEREKSNSDRPVSRFGGRRASIHR